MISPLLAPFFLAGITFAAAAAGAQCLRWLRAPSLTDPPAGRFSATPHLLLAIATGLLLIASAAAIVGYWGLLTLPAAVLIIVAAPALGARRIPAVAREFAELAGDVGDTLWGPGRPWPLIACLSVLALFACLPLFVAGLADVQVLAIGVALLVALAGLALYRPSFGISWLLVAWCLITLVAALAPPADNDWDGLAEHLAQAEIYARTATYQPLWYDHHSHFPAAVQLLFTVGVLFQGAALAKLFHWLFGVICLGAACAIAHRFIGASAAKWTALVVASTPLVGWLMQIGYVDLSTAAYGLLALWAFLAWRERPSARGAALCGLMAGGMMATKMQGIPLFGVLFAAILVQGVLGRIRPRTQAKSLVAAGVAAFLVAGPWYIKTWVLTGNPVYPFAYDVFGGKYWGEAEARGYDYHQKEFGVGDLPPEPEYRALPAGERCFTGPRAPLSLLLAPLNLTLNPVPFTVLWRQGPRALLPVLLQFWVGPLYLLGLLVLAGLWAVGRIRRRAGPEAARPSTPGAVAVILCLFAPLWAWWLISMQLSRYLLPSLLLLAPVVGYACSRIEAGLLRALPILWLATAVGMSAYVASPAVAAMTGMLDREQYLGLMCQVYEPSATLNEVMPPDGKAILYGEPRGYYIKRDYLWGDPGHHRLIPYDELKSPAALITHLRRMGITHVLINRAQAGVGPPVSILSDATQKGMASVVTRESATRREYTILDIRPNQPQN